MRTTPLFPFLLAAPVLLGQETTWTSFEDRTAHTMATDAQGRVFLFGGVSVTNSGVERRDGALLANGIWQGNHFRLTHGRTEHAMAAVGFQGRQIWVLFGGMEGGIRVRDTVVYDGGGMDPRGNNLPLARDGHAMVSDGTRIYLFGGATGLTSYENDTWALDPGSDAQTGFLWSQISTVSQPAQRRDHCMAFDAATGQVLLFGGRTLASAALADTWRFDPGTGSWTNVTPAGSPPARNDAAMAFLPGAGVVLFGGRSVAGTALDDTWVFSNGTWTVANPAIRPPGRFGHTMSLAPSGTDLLMVGGRDVTGSMLRGVWSWNGNDWSLSEPPPSARDRASFAFDGQRHLLFGGRLSAGGAATSETWQLEGLTWQQRSPVTSPPPRFDAAMTFDAHIGQTVLFGGLVGGADSNATWVWTGSTWLQRFPLASPPPTSQRAMVFDPVGQRSRMLVETDIWSYDGAAQSWTRDQYRTPPARWWPSLAYVASGPHVLMFGGYRNGFLGDTWTFDGRRWRELQPAHSPAAGWGPAMAYDAARDRVVLHDMTSGTWIWDGTDWTRFIGFQPSSRFWHRAVYDSARQRVVLFGGIDVLSGVYRSDTWEWDGSTWQQVVPTVSPSGRASFAMAYDAIRSRTVLFGGLDQLGQQFGETWEYDGVT